MKLKGKLFVIFGSVMLLALLVLGTIIYYSFRESAMVGGNELVIMKAGEFMAVVRAELNKQVEGINYALAPIVVGEQLDLSKVAPVTKQIEKIIFQNPLVEAVYLMECGQKQMILQAGRKQPEGLLALFASPGKNDSRALVVFSDHLYLSWLLPYAANSHPCRAIIELDRAKLESLTDAIHKVEESVLMVVTAKNELVFNLKHNKAQSLAEMYGIYGNELQDGKVHSLAEYDSHVYLHPESLFGSRLLVLMPNSYFLKNLTALKNRIITGGLALGWVLIWVILIFAHAISSPIRKLSGITHDIVAFNYTTELTTTSKDEIGELSRNFEAMRQKIKDLVAKDPLTHVYNRRFLMHIFELAVLKTLRYEGKLACIMIDVDFFKKVNDKYGHQCGDQVLIEMGKVLLEATRNYDTPARYGGEEFIIVLPDTAVEEAYTIAERIRLRMENMVIKYEELHIRCTISLGISTFDMYEAETTAKLINNADGALYEAKKRGRNQTVIHAQTMTDCHDCGLQTEIKGKEEPV